MPSKRRKKALKAVYQHHEWPFRYTHDLDELITGLKRNGLTIPNDVDEAAVLSGFAWEARYPGLSESVTLDEYRQAFQQAETVVAWAEQIIRT
jgi:HEPN domain-containing protein